MLSYVHGILDDLLEETEPEQSFDSDSFMEMIVAYLPQLEGIEESKVTDWMVNLVRSINDTKQEKTSASFDIKMLIQETANKQATKKTRSVSETSSEPEVYPKKRSGRSVLSSHWSTISILTADWSIGCPRPVRLMTLSWCLVWPLSWKCSRPPAGLRLSTV